MRFWNQKGESLITVMIAAGMLTTVVLVSASVMKYQMEQNKRAQQLLEANYIENQIYAELLSTETCNANFVQSGIDPDDNPTNSIIPSNQTFGDFKKVVGGALYTLYNPGDVIGNRTLQFPPSAAFQILDSPVAIPPNGSGAATLRINMLRKEDPAGGMISRDLKLAVSTNAAGVIASCTTNFGVKKIDCYEPPSRNTNIDYNPIPIICDPGYRVMGGWHNITRMNDDSGLFVIPESTTVTDPITKISSSYEQYMCRSDSNKGFSITCGAKCCRF